MNVRPLETSVRDLAPATLVYVIRDGWALAYRAEMLDDRANELYVTDEVYVADETVTRDRLPQLGGKPPAPWSGQLSMEYMLNTSLFVAERDAWCVGPYSMHEAEFRTRYGLPVDKVQHPR